jgi:hypothetical protein
VLPERVNYQETTEEQSFREDSLSGWNSSSAPSPLSIGAILCQSPKLPPVAHVGHRENTIDSIITMEPSNNRPPLELTPRCTALDQVVDIKASYECSPGSNTSVPRDMPQGEMVQSTVSPINPNVRKPLTPGLAQVTSVENIQSPGSQDFPVVKEQMDSPMDLKNLDTPSKQDSQDVPKDSCVKAIANGDISMMLALLAKAGYTMKKDDAESSSESSKPVASTGIKICEICRKFQGRPCELRFVAVCTPRSI